MKYSGITEAVFVKRINRFTASVAIDGHEETVHVKNTGRCAELFINGARCYLQKSENPFRKTAYDLIAIYKGDMLVNVDSQIPNALVEEWLRTGKSLFENVTYIKREVTFGDSRFDIYFEYGDKKAFIEVKGVTLEDNRTVRFPDAPTNRGLKHIKELQRAIKEGYEAYIFFVVQLKGAEFFEPNIKAQKEFAEELDTAYKNGVRVLSYDCIVNMDSIMIDKPVMNNYPEN